MTRHMKLSVTVVCLICDAEETFYLEGNAHDQVASPDLYKDIQAAVIKGGWVTDSWEYYCSEDCMLGEDPREEAFTIGERNPGLATG